MHCERLNLAAFELGRVPSGLRERGIREEAGKTDCVCPCFEGNHERKLKRKSHSAPPKQETRTNCYGLRSWKMGLRVARVLARLPDVSSRIKHEQINQKLASRELELPRA